MWQVQAHGPRGVTTEEFEHEAEAKAAQQRYLDRGQAVTLDPAPHVAPSGAARVCSFCGKDRSGVAHLCAGPQGVAICDQCVELVRAIFAQEAPAPIG